jgi:hypothetical protein
MSEKYQEEKTLEGAYSLSYLLLLNIEEEKTLSQKDVLLGRGIYSFLLY